MYSDVEVVENVDDVFISGLALLHSREIDSAEKLGRMLNALIEKKLAIVADRKRRRSEALSDDRTTKINSDFEDALESLEKRRKRDPDDEISSIALLDERNFKSKKIAKPDVEDRESMENIDVPRISIPDETSDDGMTVCKICKGDKLGPLILLECQECQEAYHPLCHQPAVIDIDVYDPRLVWRCGKCLETSGSIEKLRNELPLVLNLEKDHRVGKHLVNGVCRKIKTGMALETNNDKETSKNRNSGRTRSKNEIYRRATNKRSFELGSSVQLRKRVGSKLSVTRLSANQY